MTGATPVLVLGQLETIDRLGGVVPTWPLYDGDALSSELKLGRSDRFFLLPVLTETLDGVLQATFLRRKHNVLHGLVVAFELGHSGGGFQGEEVVALDRLLSQLRTCNSGRRCNVSLRDAGF